MQIIVGLMDEAREWLRYKGTDQWSRPWPDEEQHNARVRCGLVTRATWIVWDVDMPVAAVTVVKRPNPAVWSASECRLSESAVYAHRLVTSRKFAGTGLGAELINWAGLWGRRQYRAKWIRIDVWTTNRSLHDYYMKWGFERSGTCPDPQYPSGVLFQKRISDIVIPISPLFTEPEDTPTHGTPRTYPGTSLPGVDPAAGDP